MFRKKICEKMEKNIRSQTWTEVALNQIPLYIRVDKENSLEFPIIVVHYLLL